MKKTKYQKPQIKQKRIKLNFFLSNVFWVDQFNLIGDVYADSAGSCGVGACVNSSCACGGCDRCFNGCNTGQGGLPCNSQTCISGTGVGTPNGGACATASCASCVGGCNCNSTGGACNSGSGGGSGNSGSGSCNSGG